MNKTVWINRCLLIVILFSFWGCNDVKIVYISESPNAYAYHKKRSCYLLIRTTYRIKAVSLKEAKNMYRVPCMKCYD